MMRGNKFAFLVDREQVSQADTEAESAQVESAEIPSVRSEKNSRSAPNKAETPTSAEPELSPAPVKKMGRPPGKRSNPDYEQITAYIRKETHIDVKSSLLRDDKGRDFSELLQDLLDEYLRTQKSENPKV